MKTSFRSIALACALLTLHGVLLAQSTNEPALKDVFRRHFLIGAALNPRQFTQTDTRAANLVLKHFNSITSENVLKWSLIHPGPDTYDFASADQYVEFGDRHQMSIVGHTLVWNNQTPGWVFKDGAQPATRRVLLGRMKDHIHTVVSRYKGRINGWDVVNEALDDNGRLRKTEWLKIIGPDYVQKAFQFAHAADPEAELYYNDYSLENPRKRAGAIKLIKRLQRSGIPLSGVGLQGHYNLDQPPTRDLQHAIDAFARLGLKVMITELDVDVLSSAPAADHQNFDRDSSTAPFPSLPETLETALAKRYASLFTVFLRNSDKISRVTFWGVTDADSWLNNWPVRGRTNHPLLFDRAGDPKPAFWSVVETAR